MLYHISKIAGLKILLPGFCLVRRMMILTLLSAKKMAFLLLWSAIQMFFAYLSKAKNALSMRLVMRALCEE